jgi:hypothetical protein
LTVLYTVVLRVSVWPDSQRWRANLSRGADETVVYSAIR